MASKSTGLTLLEAHNFIRWAAKNPDQLLSGVLSLPRRVNLSYDLVDARQALQDVARVLTSHNSLAQFLASHWSEHWRRHTMFIPR